MYMHVSQTNNFCTGFQERLENENGPGNGPEYVPGKVMRHEKLAKSHGILSSVMEFYQFCP